MRCPIFLFYTPNVGSGGYREGRSGEKSGLCGNEYLGRNSELCNRLVESCLPLRLRHESLQHNRTATSN